MPLPNTGSTILDKEVVTAQWQWELESWGAGEHGKGQRQKGLHLPCKEQGWKNAKCLMVGVRIN